MGPLHSWQNLRVGDRVGTAHPTPSWAYLQQRHYYHQEHHALRSVFGLADGGWNSGRNSLSGGRSNLSSSFHVATVHGRP